MSVVLDVGVDLGTTMTKAAAFGPDGAVLARARTATTWAKPRPGWFERTVEELLGSVDSLLAELAADAPAGAVFRSVGFTGMAESGSLVRDGRATSPLIAWHDPRGEAELAELPAALRAAFPRLTGLPLSPLASVAKMLWLRDHGHGFAGAQWLGVSELVCLHLGADPAGELSLTGRTGLIDVRTHSPLPELLDLLGADAGLVPPLRPAGAALGRVRADYPVAALRGAVLTVAGHDHLVAAAGAGAAAPGTVFDSFGTAEAFVAATAAVPTPEQVEHLVSLGMTVYPHVVDGTTCVLGGIKSGLLLGRTLRLLGREGTEERTGLDAAAVATVAARTAGAAPGGIQVAGGRNDDHAMTITIVDDDPTPEALWCAALSSATDLAAAMLEGMRDGGIAVDRLVLAGGWSQMESVVQARRGLGVPLTLADVPQPGLVGAARMGAWAAEHDTDHPTSPPATWFVAAPMAPVGTPEKEY